MNDLGNDIISSINIFPDYINDGIFIFIYSLPLISGYPLNSRVLNEWSRGNIEAKKGKGDEEVDVEILPQQTRA
jgi:hypothetical protein